MYEYFVLVWPGLVTIGSVAVYEYYRTKRTQILANLVPKNSRFVMVAGRIGVVVLGPLKELPERPE